MVVKNLHYSTNNKEIEEGIDSHGHHVVIVWNIKNRFKKPLPMFIVDLKPAPNNSDIYKINFLLQCGVKIEAPNHKRQIPQCTNYQRYGHTKFYCQRSSRCVKCADTHHTSNCARKDKSKDVKCVLCEGNHPANYKGCTVYKDLQKNHIPSIRKKTLPTKPHAVASLSNPTIQDKIPYSQAARTSNSNLQATANPSYTENSVNNNSDIET